MAMPTRAGGLGPARCAGLRQFRSGFTPPSGPAPFPMLRSLCPQITQMNADEEFWNRRKRRKQSKKTLFSLFAPVQGCFPYMRQSLCAAALAKQDASICGHFRIRLRLAALRFLRLFAAKSPAFNPMVQAVCVPLWLIRQANNHQPRFQNWDIMAHLNPEFPLFTMLNSPLGTPQFSLIQAPKLRLKLRAIKLN